MGLRRGRQDLDLQGFRDNIYWHTGNDLFNDEKVKVTAEDVKYCLEFNMNPDNGSSRYSDLVGTIDKIEVIDPLTIQIVTKDVDALRVQDVPDLDFPEEGY